MSIGVLDDVNFEKKFELNHETQDDYLILSTYFSSHFSNSRPLDYSNNLRKWSLRFLGLSVNQTKKYFNGGVPISKENLAQMKSPHQYRSILIPINVSQLHWYLVGIFPKLHKIVVFDSLRDSIGEIEQVLQKICVWYNLVTTDLVGSANTEFKINGSWEIIKETTSQPKQLNSNDCGVYVLMSMMMIVCGQSISTIERQDIRYLRQHLAVWMIKYHDCEHYFFVQENKEPFVGHLCS